MTPRSTDALRCKAITFGPPGGRRPCRGDEAARPKAPWSVLSDRPPALTLRFAVPAVRTRAGAAHGAGRRQAPEPATQNSAGTAAAAAETVPPRDRSARWDPHPVGCKPATRAQSPAWSPHHRPPSAHHYQQRRRRHYRRCCCRASSGRLRQGPPATPIEPRAHLLWLPNLRLQGCPRHQLHSDRDEAPLLQQELAATKDLLLGEEATGKMGLEPAALMLDPPRRRRRRGQKWQHLPARRRPSQEMVTAKAKQIPERQTRERPHHPACPGPLREEMAVYHWDKPLLVWRMEPMQHRERLLQQMP